MVKKNPDNVLEYNKDYKYVLSQRKAYVDFINTDLYDKLMKDVDASMFKNYQKFPLLFFLSRSF